MAVPSTPSAGGRQLLCLTMMGYMKQGLTEEALCDFQVNKHAQLVSGLMEKYGVIRYEITHQAAATRALLPKLFDPSYVEFSDHDFIVRIIFPSVNVFESLKADPVYKERIAMDHLNFADRTRKTRMTLGYVHEIILDNKVVFVEDASAIPCQVNNSTMDENGRFVAKQENGLVNGKVNGHVHVDEIRSTVEVEYSHGSLER